jgi:hypothetical protein
MAYGGQHLPWWALASHLSIQTAYGPQAMVTGSTTRAIAVVAAIAAAWFVRNRRDPRSVMIAVTLALFARSFFEVEYWPYYVMPAAVMVAVLGASSIQANPKRFGVLLCAALLMYATSTGSYSHWDMAPLLSLTILGVSGALSFVCAFRPCGLASRGSASGGGTLGCAPDAVASLASEGVS